ncbi:hypothetical protein BST43_18895 [Mycobacteroides saopaulense]|uniref:Uncharacterized protein n=1 Tax=Mycobacteroides saopaulense TaxID=1578165 RepID=A0A1X0IWN0_9MYCO|nr:hypothetical protein [Mycobacteroides saopaulense]ORB52750.1 hypothetical protein BST43_18895 [Mycobacteroides saopaulense]
MATWGMSGPVDLLRRTGSLWWRCWPWLVAIYLVGWLLRYGALELALYVGVHVGGLWGELVFPLVPLTRILTYVAMFWVVRGAVTSTATSWAEAINTVLRAILPVFVLFTAWKLHLEDRAGYLSVRRVEYYGSTMDGLSSTKTNEQINQYLSPTDWRIYAVIAIAFTMRMLLTRFRDKLPTWTQLLALYLEATWVLLLVTAAADKLFGTPEWIKERRVVVWYLDHKESLLASLGPLRHLWESIAQFTSAAVPAILIPLTWIAIAAAVYGVQAMGTWAASGHAFFGEKHASRVAGAGQVVLERVRPQWSRLPSAIQSRTTEFARGFLGILEKLADSIRVTLHGGPLVVATYLFAFMFLVFLYPSGSYYGPQVGEGFLWRAVVNLLGPHELSWWSVYGQAFLVAIAAFIEPMKVCVVAATYGYCVERYRVAHVSPTGTQSALPR